MARATPTQSNFTGGEWSPLASGRLDDPRYTTALSTCLNHLVSEEGALVRRPGTMRLAPTYKRAAAKLIEFLNSGGCPFILEVTTGSIRMWDGASLVFTNDAQVITASSMTGGTITLTTTSAHGWSVGDQIMLNMAGTSDPGYYTGSVFQLVSGTTASTLKLQDDIGLSLASDTSFVTNTTLTGATAYRVKRFDSTGYAAADVPNVRGVQAQLNEILLVNTVQPKVVTVNEPTANTDATFTFGNLGMVDGPYLDPQSQSLTLSATSGSITLTAGSSVFASTDVGRHVRIFTQPPAYNSASSYVAGNQVTDSSGAWWQALTSVSAGQYPGALTSSGTVVWSPAPNAGTWAWGTITGFTNATTVSFTFDTTISGMALNSSNGTTASAWRLGVYSGTTGYPTCGVYYEGRIVFAGSVANRFDMSVSNGVNAITSVVTWSPTDPYGNVVDSSGISEVLNSAVINNINWMKADTQGIVCATASGEWLVSASALGDPITPTSIQAHQISSYRSEGNVDPATTPMATIFPQQYGRRIIEYLSDAFTQRYTGETLNEMSRHMSVSGVSFIRYQNEPIPIVWAVTNSGELLGCTYRRISRFVTEKPVLMAWTRNQHGGGLVTGIAVAPASTGVDGDRCYIVVNDAGAYYVELLQPSVEVKPIVSVRDGWFVDSAGTPSINKVTKCGFLYPSGGYNVSSTYTPATWTAPTTGVPSYITGQLSPDAAPSSLLQTPGVTLPNSIPPNYVNFILKQNGVYFNGDCLMTSLWGSAASGKNVSISVWLWIDGDQGALMNNRDPLCGVSVNTAHPGDVLYVTVPPSFWELSQVLGTEIPVQTMGFRFEGITTPGGVPDAWLFQASDFGSPGFAQQWAHFMFTFGIYGTQNYLASVYVNDTQLYQATAALPNNDATIDWSQTAIGGHRFITNNNTTGGGTPTEFYEEGFPGQYPDADGLKAGMAELWINITTGVGIDWSVAANRQKFHTTNLAGNQWIPVSLGANGQTPLGTKPTLYCSGLPKNFRFNRANGLKVQTYNNGAYASFTQAFDPSDQMLDELPSYIENPPGT